MRELLIILTTLLIIQTGSFSQKADSCYYFQIRDKQTRESLPFSMLHAYESGSAKWSLSADINGIVTVPHALWNDIGNITLKATYPGYQPLQLEGYHPQKRDTLKMDLSHAGYYLDPVEIVGYQMPLIDKYVEEPKTRKARKNYTPPAYVDSSAIYPDYILARYDSIVNGTWFLNQKRTSGIAYTNFYQTLQRTIPYPEHALKYGLEETICFSLSITRSGHVNEILLKKGICPILVVTAAEVISKIERIVYDNPAGGYDNGSQNTQEIFILPVRFILH